MGLKRYRTLGDLIGTGLCLRVRCGRCRREALFDAREVYAFHGGARALDALRFVCSTARGGCGAREVRIDLQSTGAGLRGQTRREDEKPAPVALDDGQRRRLGQARPLDDGRR